MSTVIDERVVEMRFDNRQFEENAKESINTLSKLKVALDNTDNSKALENLDKAAQNIHLDGIAAGVEALQRRFSVFGLVGIKAVNGVANALLGMTKKLYNATIGQITSGGVRRAMNIENAHFQLQALLKDETKVQEVMNDANKAVDGTAYSLDAAAKAASQFAATGIQAGQEMQDALRGIVGVSAMTNSDFESISMIFTTVAGQGRVMGDQLNQLASRGLNAAATMAEFVNGVNDGSKQASEEVTKLVKTFSNGTKLTEGDIRNLVSKGKISFKLFSESMTEAFADSAEKANETFTGAMSNVKSALARIGAGFISPLIAQNSKIVELFNTLRLKINEFKKYIVFDESIGNVMALSKQFTDFVLKMAEVVKNSISNIDTTSVMRDVYYGLEIIKNVFKALWVLVKPALMVLSGLINPIGDGLHTIMVALEAITSKMIASENVSTAIGEVLREIVNILGTLISLGLELIQKVFKSTNKETKKTSDGFLGLLRSISIVLKGFNEWLKNSTVVSGALDILSIAIRSIIETISFLAKIIGGSIMIGLSTITTGITNFVKAIRDAKSAPDIIKGIKNSFKGFDEISSNIKLPKPIQDYIDQFKQYLNRLEEGLPNIGKNILDGIKRVISGIGNFNQFISNSVKSLGLFGNSVKQLETNISPLNGIRAIFDKVVESGERFLKFIIESSDSIIGLTVGFTIIRLLTKTVDKTIGNVNGILNGVAKLLTSTTGAMNQFRLTLKAYSRDLNATALLKVAGAISILSGALILLSFADPKRLLVAAVSIGIVGTVLISALSVWEKISGKTKNVYTVMDTLAKKLGSAARWKAIGSAVKSLGESVMMIAGSIIAISLMYKNNASEMNEAVKLITAIGLCIVGIITTMSILGKVVGTGMRNFAMAAFGVAAISGSLLLIIISLNKLFKMDLPYDYQQKLNILYGIMFSLSGMVAILNIISSIGHGGKGNTIAISHLFFSLHAVISAMQRLFKMDLPKDYVEKLNILASIFVELGLLMVTLGAANRLANGKLKAGGTILAASVFLISAVTSLAILTLLPMDKLLKSTITLGSILLALGTALLMASKITDLATAKAILNMAISVGVIVTALSVLTLFKGSELLKSAAALGSVLVAFGYALKSAENIKDAKSLISLLSMIAVTAEIEFALYKLSEQPWKGMLASGIAMGLTLRAYAKAFEALGEVEDLKIKTVLEFILAATAVLPLSVALYGLSTQPWKGMLASGVAMGITLQAYAKAFATLGESEDTDMKQVGRFIAAAFAVIPLGLALGVLAHQPWAGMLASGVAMSATLIAFAKAFEILSNAEEIDVKQIGSFLLASVSVIPLGLALGVLAHQPWAGMLGAAVALSATLLAFSGCFTIISKAGSTDPKLALTFVASSLALLPIAYALKMISEEPWQELLGAAASLSLVLVALAGTMAICTFVGQAAGPAAIGIVLLIAFIAGLTLLVGVIGALVDFLGAGDAILRGIEIIQQVGEGLGNAIGSFIGGVAESATSKLTGVADNLADFMEHLKPFTDGLKYITEDSIQGVMMLGKMISSLTTAELTQGLSKILGGESNFALLGEQLNLMAPYLQTFSESVKGISPESVEGAKTVSDITLALSDSLPRVGGILDNILGKKKTLTDFAMELVSFGPSIKQFSEIVKDVKPESVEGAAAAGEIMAKLGNILPESGGLIQKIFGDKTLSEFAQELIPFGVSIKTFSEIVKDVKPESVEGAAAAGEMMAKLGNVLPESDGLVQKIFGDKTLSEFAQELIPFGVSIKQFSEIVKDVKLESVEGAANAGEIMARMATGLPNSGGVLGWLMGENDIDTFGTRLVSYGNSIVEFAGIVSGLNPLVLVGVAVATQMMSKLAEALPDTGDVFDMFIGGKMDFEEFGNQLEKFGKSLAKYSDSISSINLMQVTMATGTLKSLVDMLTTVQGIDQNALSNFAITLSSAPAIAIQEFVSGFQNGITPAIDSVNQFFDQVNYTILEASETLSSTMRTSVSVMAIALAVFLPIAFSNVKTEMIRIGEFIGDGLAIGISNKMDRVRTAATDMAKVVEDAVSNKLKINSPSKVMIELGGYTVAGFKEGIRKNLNGLDEFGLKMGKMVDDSLRAYMKIHSPSEREIENGENTSKGYAIGIENGLPDILKSIDGVIEKTSNAWNEGTSKITEEIKNSKVYEVYGEKWKDEGDKFLNGLTGVLGMTAEAFNKQNKETLEDQAKTHKASLQAEETYWEKLLKIRKEGADKKKYKKMSIADFQKEILNETMNVWKDYVDQLSSTRDSIMSTMDLFSEVTKSDSVKSKEELKKNLEDQIKAYREYAETLQSINLKTGDSELGKYLRTLGVDSLEQLKVINSMTDEELTNYSELYDTKLAYATNIAANQLTELQETTEQKLADLYGGMVESVSVFDFGKVFDGTFKSIDEYVQGVMLPLQEATIKAAEEASKVGSEIVEGLEEGLTDGEIKQSINEPLYEAIELAEDEQVSNAKDLGVELGTNIQEGIEKGIESADFNESAKTLIDSAVEALQTQGEIHSPSKLTEREVGIHLAEGVANGLSGVYAQESINQAVVSIIGFIVQTFNDNQIELEECAMAMSDVIREGIVYCEDDLVSDIENIVDEIIFIFTDSWNYDTIFKIGSDLILYIQNGVLFSKPIFLQVVLLLCMEVVQIFLDILNEETFNEIGRNIILYTDDGIKSVQNILFTTCYRVCRKVVSIFKSYLSYGRFFSIGRLAMQGLADGIISKLEEVMAKAVEVANATAEAVKTALDIHSPSRVFFKIGENIVQGMANGMEYASNLVTNAGTDISEEAIESVDAVQKAINAIMMLISEGEFDPEMVITPVVDISQVRSGVDEITSMFNRNAMLTARNVMSTANAFEYRTRSDNERRSENDQITTAGSSYSFNQYNYSPKALSRIDIYRQTRNQFRQFKEATK